MTYFFGEVAPTRWVDDQWIEESSDLLALVIGESYFVAENIKFERV